MSRDVSGVLRRLSEGVVVRPLGDDSDREPVPIKLESVLASLVDLGGTVRLADHLATRARTSSPGPEAPRSPIRDSLARRIDEIGDEARAAFREPFSGRRALPTAEIVTRMLVERSALASRSEAAARDVAASLAAQARERFDHQIGKGRQRIRWLRTDVAADLRALGPKAASVEALDAVVARAMESGLARVHVALERRLDEVFVARFAAAVLALPEVATDASALYAPTGMMTRHAAELGELLVTLLDVELDAVLALVDTAYAVRNQEALS